MPDVGDSSSYRSASGSRTSSTVMPSEHPLRCSFQHLPGISASGEERLWAKGVLDWAELIQRTPEQLDLYRKHGSTLQSAVEASEKALANRDIAFFAHRLPKREYYRVAASFPEHCVFLDIESTGLSTYYDKVTLVGWSVGYKYKVLIDPCDVKSLENDLYDNQLIVTFNGSLFDLPFLAKSFGADWTDLFHIDLRYLAKRVGLTGGQKKIEAEIGLAREASLQGIAGAEAVSLWFDYKEGDLNALRELIRYNHADIEGMKFLFEEVIHRLAPQVDTHDNNDSLFQRSRIRFSDMQSVVTEANAVPIHPYRGAVGPRLTFANLHSDNKRLDDTTIVGIDLTGSEQRQSGWAAVTGRNLTTTLIASDAELTERTLAAEPFLVSIDSPLSLPSGRISEFDDDPGRHEYGIVREAERQLRSRGVHVYPALLPSMQRLTRRGIELASHLRKRGIPVIESYPGAAQDILGIPRKKTSLKHLMEGLRRFGYAGLTSGGNVSHDELDAVTSALVGQFMLSGYWEALGSIEEDYLIVPTVERRPPDQRPHIAIGLSGPIAAGKTTAAKFLERLGFFYCRFSEIIEQEVKASGAQVTRDALQAFGEQIYRSRFGQRQLQNKLAKCVGQTEKIVVDGLRHPEDRAFLRERWGVAAFHIHIDAYEDLRIKRYTTHGLRSNSDFHRAEAHTVEQNVPRMKILADLTVMNAGSLDQFETKLRETVNGELSCR